MIRQTYDQLLDGQRTGRWDYRDLRKTEKTHMGTLVEINLHREFEFEDGRAMDYRIAGVEVDCKFSQSPRGWQIPLEATGYVCLLLWADDGLGLFSGGLLRISEDVLRPGGNRDQKRTLNAAGCVSCGACGTNGRSRRISSCSSTRTHAMRSSLPTGVAGVSGASMSSSGACRDDWSAVRRCSLSHNKTIRPSEFATRA